MHGSAASTPARSWCVGPPRWRVTSTAPWSTRTTRPSHTAWQLSQVSGNWDPGIQKRSQKSQLGFNRSCLVLQTCCPALSQWSPLLYCPRKAYLPPDYRVQPGTDTRATPPHPDHLDPDPDPCLPQVMPPYPTIPYHTIPYITKAYSRPAWPIVGNRKGSGESNRKASPDPDNSSEISLCSSFQGAPLR